MVKGENPSEFAGFVRDAGIRAFDRLSERTKEVATPLRGVLRAWSKLAHREKEALFDALIATTSAEEKPLAKKAARKSSKKKT